MKIEEALKAIDGVTEETVAAILVTLAADGFTADMPAAGAFCGLSEGALKDMGFNRLQVATVIQAQKVAKRSTSLSSIPEEEDFTPEQMRKIRQIAREVHIPKAPSSSASASQLGQQLLQKCSVTQLVTVSKVAQDAAQKWLNKAGMDQGQTGHMMQKASESSSCLAEKSDDPSQVTVQSIVTALLESQPGGTYKVHHVHDKASVCDSLRPDVVVSVGDGDPLPSTTALVLELKRQDGSYFSNEHVYQVYRYGIEMLEQLPLTYRSYVLLGITDLRKIRFLCVIRTNDGFQCERSEEIDEVLPALCAVLNMGPHELQARPPPALKFHQESLPLKKLLGVGATATVFETVLKLNGRDRKVAAKVFEPGHSADIDLQAIEELAEAGCSGVPTVVGRLDPPHVGYLLHPVGMTLAAPGALEQHPWLFKALAPLVDTLRQAHKLSWVHRDVRLCNLLLVPDGPVPGSGRVVLLDWGFAVRTPSSTAAEEFCGAARTASDRLLEQLERSQAVTAEASDDLDSLVKAMFVLSHPKEAYVLHDVPQRQYAQLRQAWTSLFNRHPWWAKLQRLAADANYDAVAAELTKRFD